jgi:hypothetical protein
MYINEFLVDRRNYEADDMTKWEYKNYETHTSANRCACSGLDATCGLMKANIELICCPVL